MRQLNFVLATDSKIVSINSLYGAKLGWAAGRPYPQLYRSNAAMKFEREVREQLLALHLDQEWVDWFKETKQFSMTVNFILRSGIARRDVSNCDKALIDTITRFIKYDLGCEDFDDSLFADVHFYKSTIPQGAKEYCCVQIKESTHNMRFDIIPKPEKIWIWNNNVELDLPKIPKRRKKGQIYLETVENKLDANTYLYVISPDNYPALDHELLFDLAQDKCELLNGESGSKFMLFCVMGKDWNDQIKEKIQFIKQQLDTAHQTYSGIEFKFVDDTSEILKWLQQ